MQTARVCLFIPSLCLPLLHRAWPELFSSSYKGLCYPLKPQQEALEWRKSVPREVLSQSRVFQRGWQIIARTQSSNSLHNGLWHLGQHNIAENSIVCFSLSLTIAASLCSRNKENFYLRKEQKIKCIPNFLYIHGAQNSAKGKVRVGVMTME